MRPSKLITWTLAGLVAFGTSRPLPAREFSPEACFPASTILWLEVDVGGLRAAISRTPFGRILAHPQLRKALGQLPEMIRREIVVQTRELDPFLGGDVFRFLEVMAGKWTIAVEDSYPYNTANVYVALDLRDHAEPLKGLVEMYLGVLGQAFGTEPTRRAVSGQEVRSVPLPIPQHAVHTAVLGDHLVLGFGVAGRFDAVVGRFAADDGAAGGAGLDKDAVFARTRPGGLESPLARAVLHVVNLREAVGRVLGRSGAEESLAMAKQVLASLGLDRVASIEYELALTDGDWEESLRIESPGGLGGLVELLAESLGGGDAEALARVPAKVSALASFSFDAGRFLRELEKLAQGLPEALSAVPLLESLARGLQQATGLSMKDDLQTLPKLDVAFFRAAPPDGGLLPDSYALCRTEQIVPYLQALDKFARKVQADITGLEIEGHDVAYLRVASLLRGFGVGPSTGPLVALPDEAKLAILALDPGVSIAFTPLEADWVLIADTPQAIERYLLRHATAEKIVDVARWRPLLETTRADGAAVLLLGGGESVLVGYNSLLAVISVVGPTLEEIGVDHVLLPAGEEFLPYFQPGYVHARSTDDAIEIRAHRVLTNALSMVVPEALGVLARLAFTP